MGQDIRYALRQIGRNKLFSIAVPLLLAVGIGANTLIFSFINELLLKRLPVRNPQSLLMLEKNRQQQVRPDTEFFYSQVEDLARRTDLFSSVIAEESLEERTQSDFLPFTSGDTTRLLATEIVSPNYFSDLGVRAILGRVLTEADATSSSQIPVVLSYQFWQSQFNGDRAVLGTTIRIKSYPFVIVGILPREFHSLDIDRSPDVRFPISAAFALTGHSISDPKQEFLGFRVVVRLAPGVTHTQAATAILPSLHVSTETLWRESELARPQPWPREQIENFVKTEGEFRLDWRPVGYGLSELRGKFSEALILLMCGVGLLLLVVCANIGGLVFAKSEERRREIAVRFSMGAGRARLVRQLLTENLILAIPGATLGAAIAYLCSPVLIGLLPPVTGLAIYKMPRVLTVEPDLRMLSFTIALTLLSVLLFGMVPAWRGTRLNLSEELKASGRAATAGRQGLSATAVQVGIAVVLLSAAALMLETYWSLEHLNPGFDRAHVDEFLIDPWDAGYSSTKAALFYRELREQILALPQTRSVAYASMELMRGFGVKTTIAPQGVVLPKGTFLNTSLNSVTPDYFKTLGIPLLAGRSLDASDVKAKPQPIVVNSAFADYFFPHQNPIGKGIVQGTDGTQPLTSVIVGVAGTAKYRSMREQEPPISYSPADYGHGDVLYLRTYGDPTATIGAVRGVLRNLDPRVLLVEANTLEQDIQSSLWQERLVMLLSGFFGVIAVMLSGIGLYAALVYSVTRRRRELGIRIAIGAQDFHIVQTVCGRASVAVGIGLAVGLAVSAALLGFTRSLLYGVSPHDPKTLLFTVLGALLCSLSAVAFPTWRAMRTNPVVALREE
jgi:predicted permease